MTRFLFLFLPLSAFLGAPVERIVQQPAPNMTRAEIWCTSATTRPKAVLVICPGMNGSAEGMVKDKNWQSFADLNNLALVGLSYSSPVNQLDADLGYTSPDLGSGNLLLQAIQEKWGDTPLLLYGFSSGAYFVERFVQWKPERVLAWCAHATGRFENAPCLWPPGIVSCGENDSSRLGAALTHFKKGRIEGSKLLWICLPACGHSCPSELNTFVQVYFREILASESGGIWVDIDNKTTISEAEALRQPSLSGWMPSEVIVESWRKIHQP